MVQIRSKQTAMKELSYHFDAAYYLSENSDVRDHGVDPLSHFLSTGWREGRSPSCRFDVGYYLRVNQDVAVAGINPLVHYVCAGSGEGRLPIRPLNAQRQSLEAARPLSVRGKDWSGAADDTSALPGPVVLQALASALDPVWVL